MRISALLAASAAALLTVGAERVQPPVSDTMRPRPRKPGEKDRLPQVIEMGGSILTMGLPPHRSSRTVTRLAKPSSNRKAQLLEKAARRQARAAR